MKDDDQPAPKPQQSGLPPRPPRGPTIAAGLSGGDEPHQPNREVRINLPPKPTTAPTVKLPTLTPAVEVPTGLPKRRPWWKFW